MARDQRSKLSTYNTTNYHSYGFPLRSSSMQLQIWWLLQIPVSWWYTATSPMYQVKQVYLTCCSGFVLAAPAETVFEHNYHKFFKFFSNFLNFLIFIHCYIILYFYIFLHYITFHICTVPKKIIVWQQLRG